jgi:DNA-binding MarR family transcriptional regulator
MGSLEALRDGEARAAFDRTVETMIFLYTESRRLTKEEARKHELTGPQLTVIKLLAGVGDLSLTRLSGLMQTRNSTVTGIIDRMESAGLVKRMRSETDRRVVHLRLTAAGKRLATAVPIEPMQVFRRALETLSAAEQKTLLRILSKLERHVRSQLRENEAGPNASATSPAGGEAASNTSGAGASTATSSSARDPQRKHGATHEHE